MASTHVRIDLRPVPGSIGMLDGRHVRDIPSGTSLPVKEDDAWNELPIAVRDSLAGVLLVAVGRVHGVWVYSESIYVLAAGGAGWVPLDGVRRL